MLTLHPRLAHHVHVSAKSDTGHLTPRYKESATQTPPASFFVSNHHAHPLNGSDRFTSMVALVGQSKGWPVSDNAGCENPASVTTNKELLTSGSDSHSLLSEIAQMAIDASAHLKTFIFAAVERANLKSTRPVMLHITAATERLARQSASRQYVLSFAGVIQNGGAL
ncbi:host cell division inhibitor Icd-like protein [Hafnia alvei]|uniref:host cell division inhibitor Icd-like protein n=1 Tax=Hafnia alvei TaxID=569 RepID=UPI0016424E01|nr:host cell division inhibitor Icd-like protein [Hafnia alvei]MBI0276743.1 host cell division inhibitor Icd-like protein [Hafnia alvei]